jgi:gluconokinase
MKIVVMGVSGSGKTTVGTALARRLGVPFLDADDFHPRENIAKMAAGVPLDDADREPWLTALNRELHSYPAVVLACSALKSSYREALAADTEVTFVWLSVDRATIRDRFTNRSGHFMNAGLIDSQFAALEVPNAALMIDGTLPVEEILEQILKREPPA